MERDDVISTLNTLITTCKDGEEGFRTCVDNVKDLTLRAFFIQKAERCRQGAVQLQAIVREMGGDPETGGSLSGAVHRFWVDIRGAISSMDDHAILDECERGEDSAKKAYEAALKNDLPGDVRRVIENQYREVMTNHDRVKELRNITV